MFDEKYHHIKTVADMLPDKRTPDWVIKQLVDPDRDADGSIIIWISPHYCPSKSIELLDHHSRQPVIVEPRPLLVENLQECCKFDDKGIHFDETNDNFLLSDELGNDYLPPASLFIPYSSLRLRTDEFYALLEQVERNREALARASERSTNLKPILFDPEKYIDDCIAKGMAPLEIVYKLVTEHGTRKEKYYGLIARRFCEPNLHLSDASWRQKGSRLFKKAFPIYVEK